MPDLCAHSLEVMLPVPSDYWGSANISNTPKLCKHDVMVALIFFFYVKIGSLSQLGSSFQCNTLVANIDLSPESKRGDS